MKERRFGSKTVCMPVYSYYPFDPRVRRAAEALLEEGHSVDVICLRGRGQEKKGTYNGVNIHRVSLTHKRGGYLRYFYHYTMFFIQVFITLNRLDVRRRYDVVHVHSLPDFLVFVAIVQKLKGKKIILDLHEVMPEIYAARFRKKMKDFSVKGIAFLERISTAFADGVITVNDVRREVIVMRGVPKRKITVIMNTPDEKLFVKGTFEKLEKLKAERGLEGKFITVYVGGINPERNLEVILKAMAIVKNDIPEVFFLLFGHTYGQAGVNHKEDLRKLSNGLGLRNNVYIGGELRGEEVASYMELAHYGVVSYLVNPMTELAMPNKVFEYIALDKPIIACRLRGLVSLLGDAAVIYYNPGDERDLAEKIRWVYNNPDKVEEMTRRAWKIYEKHTWAIMKKRLNDLYYRI
ncbi:MAG: glycosyltransferase family 4 protein [Thermoplasmata archaeon]|nr:MAG: glycosyltransferase family 4 protein [Thermoplasmata archaeon]